MCDAILPSPLSISPLTLDHRLRSARSPSGEILPWQGAGHLGPGHPALHARLQGEPLLQHRRDPGSRAAYTMGFERVLDRLDQSDAGQGCGSAFNDHASQRTCMVHQRAGVK